jgi:hypothetical protein
MKKIHSLVLAVLCLSATNLFAQQGGDLKFGVEAGANFSNLMYSNDVQGDVKIGFQAGITAHYYFSENFFLKSGLSFQTKGCKSSVEVLGVETESSSTPMYLQLPVHFGYNVPLGGMSVNLHLGPYFAYGIGGKNSVTTTAAGVSNTTDYDFFGDNAAKPFDAGIGLGAGIDFGSFGVNIGGDYGLTSLSRSDAVTVNNLTMYLTLSYKF